MLADHARAQAVFVQATEIVDPVARTSFIAESCGGDHALRARVEALLRAHDQTDSLLDVPLVNMPRSGEDSTKAFSPNQTTAGATNVLSGETADDEPLTFLDPPTRPDSLGRIGHYHVLQILGRGAFGIVFRAFDDVLQRVVAVKVMAPQLAATSPARRRFMREAQSSAKVRHDNVVQVHDVKEKPLPYLVMEFIPGETLQQMLDRTGPLDVNATLQIGRQIAEGLAAAHATDLIHRDIKPGNILIEDGQRRVKITDFGLARAADDASISQSGIIAGTPMYMAPEQAKGEKLDQRADLFSLGSVLYQMLTGRPPFRANGTVAVLKRVADDTPRDIREIIPETPQWICNIIAKLHEKKPDERFQTAREVADVLADCEAQLKENSKLKDYSRIPLGKPVPPGRRKWVAAAAVLLLPTVVLAVTELAGVTHLFRGQPETIGPVEPGKSQVVAPAASDATQRLLADAVLLLNFEKENFYEKDGKTYVRDLSGRDNDGVCENVSVTPDGKAGGGLACQGGALCIPNSLINGRANYTITGWCRWDAIAPAGSHYLYSSATSKRRESLFAFCVPPERSFHVNALHKDRVPPADNCWLGAFTPTGVVPEQGWYFFAVTLKDGGVNKGALRVTVDDVSHALNSQMVRAHDGTEVCDLIGFGMSGAVIDEVTVFPRALSDYEISALRELGQNRAPLSRPAASSVAAGWVSLFNGKNLAGWTGEKSLWAVENGLLVTRVPKDAPPKSTVLQTIRNDFQDFHVRLEGKINDGGDSGLFVRVQSGAPLFLQAQIAVRTNDALLNYHKALANAKSNIRPNQWFTMEVIANGPHVVLRVDGEKVADWTDPEWVVRSGFIALETGWPGTEFFVRKIEVKELPASSPPPTHKNTIGMEFVLVPKGKSWLGGGKDKLGDKEVDLPADFYLGKYEVTQEEWEKIMGENPSHFSRTGSGKDAVKDIADADLKRFPVEMVSWDQCQLFVAKLNKREKETGWVYRLPTEVEWEYACRGGPMADRLDSAFDYYFAKPTNALLPEQANFNKGQDRTCKVGSYETNRVGLFDLHGNVIEWCEDTEKGAEGASTGVSRGGGWLHESGYCRPTFRHQREPSFRGYDLGLRLARVSSGAPSSAE